MRVGLCKPSFEEEEEGTEGNQRMFGRTRGSTILLWIPSVLIFSVLDRRCCATCWGDIMKEFAIGDFERSTPHLFLYLFYLKGKKVETKRTLPILNTGESKLYSKKSDRCLKHRILFYFCFFIIFFFM